MILVENRWNEEKNRFNIIEHTRNMLSANCDIYDFINEGITVQTEKVVLKEN